MKSRATAVRSWWVLALAAGMTGCQDRDVGTIRADRGALEALRPANSDPPPPPSSPRSKGRPDYNLRSPKHDRLEAKK
jgi:hypothetical protein